jgi:hypothetical protein
VLIILVALMFVIVVTSIWAIIDAALRPPEAFDSAGESKALWITLIVGFTLFLGFVGFIVAIVYLFSIRRKVNNWSGDALTKPPPVAPPRRRNYLISWMLVGGSYAMVVVGAFTIGIFFIPIAICASVFLIRKQSSRQAIPGLFGGLALPLFYVAYLNRSGPGIVCTTTRNDFGVDQSCIQEWSPWLWLISGLVLLGVGAAIFIITLRSSKSPRCADDLLRVPSTV